MWSEEQQLVGLTLFVHKQLFIYEVLYNNFSPGYFGGVWTSELDYNQNYGGQVSSEKGGLDPGQKKS